MAEKKKLIDSETVVYSGLFDYGELRKLIDDFLIKKKFSNDEQENSETISQDGKDIDVYIAPSRTITSYIKHKIKIMISIKDMKDVATVKDGAKLKLNQGKVRISFSAFLVTEYEGMWSDTPLFIIIRSLLDKYFVKQKSRTNEGGLIQDTRHLKTLVKSFLNLHRY